MCIGWIPGSLCDLDLWPHPWTWPWIFQGLIDVKRKGSESVRYWAGHMAWPVEHTHDLNVSKLKFEIALPQERKGRLTWNERESIHSRDIGLCVTMVAGWVDVPESDQGDFIRRASTYLVFVQIALIHTSPWLIVVVMFIPRDIKTNSPSYLKSKKIWLHFAEEIFKRAFSWIKINVFWSKFHISLLTMVQLVTR